MVSRRKILSRSRDDLKLDQSFQQEEEEDIWHQKDKLFKVYNIFDLLSISIIIFTLATLYADDFYF